jgi:hypothetical protein
MTEQRKPIWLTFAALLASTCAHSSAPGPAAGGATGAAATSPALPDDGPLQPLPKRAPEAPMVDHPEERPVKIVARDVSNGFETLIARTEQGGCGSTLDGGGEVRVEGGADPRRPWSAWFTMLEGPKLEGLVAESGAGYLIVRRPLPAAGEHQVAHVYLTVDCGGPVGHFRFVLPDADPKAHDPRVLAHWANAFQRHIGESAWGQFASTRVHELFPEPPPPAPVASLAVAKSGKPGKPGKPPKGAKGAKAVPAPAKPIAAAPRPRVNVPRRESSDLARLMETTTGVTSLQETLQTDRWLAAATDEPASVALADVKPPPLPAHPFAAMLAALGKPVPAEPLAAATPADFYFVRFKSLAHLFRLRDELDAGLSSAVVALDERFADYDLAARVEAELGVRENALTRMLGPSVVEDVAAVGSDPYLREGSDLTLVFRVKAAPAFDAALAATLAAHGAAHGGLTTSTVDVGGVPVQIARSADGAIRRHRASAGGFEILSNSLGALRRVLDTIAGRSPRLAAEPDFRYMLARDAAVPADVLAFMSDRFVAAVIGPRQKILEARRQVALAELSRPGFAALAYGWLYGRAPASADELVASGLLKRQELAHGGGGDKIDWQPGRPARSSWGRIGALTPLIDLAALDKVTPLERDAYAMFVSGYQDYWRAYVDPVALRIAFAPQPTGPLAFDLRILPIISGTDYAQMSRTVGRARIAMGDGKRVARTALGIGPDAELRHLLSQSLKELPLVGALKVDWLGDWAIVGMEDTRRPGTGVSPAQQADMGKFDRLADSLVELPLYAGVEVKNRAAAAAFLAGARQVVDHAAPGVIEWNEAGKEREVPFVAIRSAAGPEESRSSWHALALYYSFCKSSLMLSLSEAALRRRIDECVDGAGPRAIAKAAGEGPQWIFEVDLRERGPLWWWLANGAAATDTPQPWKRSATAAEAVLRGVPGTGPAAARAVARDVLGAAPVTPEGRDYVLAADGLRDPIRGRVGARASADLDDLLASDDSPFVRLLRAISHVRSEVSFDEEPDVASSARPADHTRSLHVRLRLGS